MKGLTGAGSPRFCMYFHLARKRRPNNFGQSGKRSGAEGLPGGQLCGNAGPHSYADAAVAADVSVFRASGAVRHLQRNRSAAAAEPDAG